MTNVGELGEFGLIERLRGRLGASEDERLVIGIGDDAAVWRTREGFTIATTDTMVAGVHFLPGRVDWREVGWKALAVNISDIAAMGGSPSFALVTLCLPPDTPVTAADALYDGMQECAEIYGVTIAGGDIVASDRFTITIAIAGDARVDEAGNPLLLRRDTAKPGDLIAVSGPLGGSAGGLRVLQLPPTTTLTEAERKIADVLVERHMHPWPRADAGDLGVRAGIRCGMDISDGLMQDLGRICSASGVGADVRFDDLPLEDGLETLFPEDARKLAATGGEDYELLLVGGPQAIDIADGALRAHLEMPDDRQLIIIGEITAEAGKLNIDAQLPRGGWDHLAADRSP